jgi:hypothetical protein
MNRPQDSDAGFIKMIVAVALIGMVLIFLGALSIPAPVPR